MLVLWKHIQQSLHISAVGEVRECKHNIVDTHLEQIHSHLFLGQ